MGEVWRLLRRDVHAVLVSHPLVVIALVIFAEEFGIPTPVPGEVIMLFAGYGVAQGRYPLWLVLLVEEVATVAGSSGLYFFSRGAGRPLILRYGHLLHIGPGSLRRAATAVQRLGGWWAIVAGRVVPGFRIVTPVAAGVLAIPGGVFVSGLAVGGFIYLLAFTLLGRVVGPAALVYFERVLRLTNGLLSLAAVIGLVLIIRWLRREQASLPLQPLLASLLAGFTAGVAALLAANSVLALVDLALTLLHRSRIVVAPVLGGARELSSVLHLLLGWPGFLLAATLLGVLATRLYPAYLSLHLASATIAFVPFLVSTILLLAVIPHLSGSRAGDRSVILVLLELVRVVVFAVVLTQVLPLTIQAEQSVDAREVDPSPSRNPGN